MALGGGGWSDWRSRARRWGGGGSTSRSSPRPTTPRPRTVDRSEVDWRQATQEPYNPQTYRGFYNRTPEQAAAGQWWRENVPYGQRTHSAFTEFMSGAGPTAPGAPTGPTGPGGGGRGYGGGGGGGGGAAPMTQAMLDQMLAALGTRGPALALQQTNLPAFQGQALQAFNPSQYNLAQQQLEQARAADAAAITAAGTRATQALQGNYTNAYANTPVVQGPVQAEVGVGLQQTAGGGGNQQAATDVNQAAAGDQASFQNLMNVLAAADQSSQASRLNEAALNTNTAQLGLGAQVRGLGAGINQARAQAYNQWQQQANERNYQNSLMRQQWAREGLMRNQDIANQQRQANWQQSNELISTRLQPLLEMIGGTAGTKLNLAGIQNLLKLWGQGAR